jgi:hypothetical protein
MRTNVSRPASLRSVTMLLAISLLLGATVAQGAAAPTPKSPVATSSKTGGQVAPLAGQQVQAPAPAPLKDWGPYLDVAYELTYWEKPEIKDWREKREKEIGQPLSAYIAAWKEKLPPLQESTGAGPKDAPHLLHQQREYLRLAIAQTIVYLQSDNLESLNDARQTLQILKEKTPLPEIAYWTGFATALQAMENKDSAQFVTRVYEIWNGAIMYIAQGEIGEKGAETTSDAKTPFYYRNLVHLIVNRAIIEHKLDDLSALGPIFFMLNGRDFGSKDGEGQFFATLVQRVVEGMVAPDSDRYRLNFTVAMIESKRLQQIAAAKIDAEGMSVNAQRAFEQARLYNDCALKWAASRRSSGVAVAVVDFLDSSSFAIQRLADNEKAPAYQYFAMLPTHDGSHALLNAMAVFNDIAAYSEGGWEKAGYASREAYLKSTHRLWRAIMEMALWTGDYYLGRLNVANDQQSVFDAATPMQVVLDSYLDFLASQKSRGFGKVIPDSAYFGASEAASKLAYAYLKVQTYASDSSAYDLWFLHGLQAAELFPLDPQEPVRTAGILRRDGRYNLFLDYYLPLSRRFKQSPAVRNWLETEDSDTVKTIREKIDAIDVAFAGASRGTGGVTKDAGRPAFIEGLREELQRKPDHPVHRLLKAFYLEEMQKDTSYTQLLKDPRRLDRE